MKDEKSFPESEMFPTPTAWWADQMETSTDIGWVKGGVYDGHYAEIRRHTDCKRHDDGTFVSESWVRFNLPKLTDREITVFREWLNFNKAKYGRFYGSDEPNWDDVTWFIVPNRMSDYRFDWDHERHPLEAFVGNTYEGEMYRRGAVLDLNLVEMYDKHYPVIGLSYSGWYQHLAMANFLHDLADHDTRGSRRWRTHARTFEDRVIWLAMPKGTWRCRPFVDDSEDSNRWWNSHRVTTPIGNKGAHRFNESPDGLPRDEWLICYEGFFCFPDLNSRYLRNTQDDARIEFRNALGFDSDEAYLAGREAITKRRREAASGWIST